MKMHAWQPYLTIDATRDDNELEFHCTELRLWHREENQRLPTPSILYFYFADKKRSAEDQAAWARMLPNCLREREINVVCGYVGGNGHILEIMARIHTPLSTQPCSQLMWFEKKETETWLHPDLRNSGWVLGAYLL